MTTETIPREDESDRELVIHVENKTNYRLKVICKREELADITMITVNIEHPDDN